MLRWCVRTVDCSGKGLIIQFILFGRLLDCMFVVHWFALLYCWVIRNDVIVEAGLRAASALPFWLFVVELFFAASRCSSLSLPFGVSTIYMSCEEVAF